MQSQCRGMTIALNTYRACHTHTCHTNTIKKHVCWQESVNWLASHLDPFFPQHVTTCSSVPRSTLSPPASAPALHAHPGPSTEGLPPPVETGLVWLPTMEMMDWRLTYGKGRGLQVNKRRAVLNTKERKKTCSTFWLGRRGKGDRNAVCAVCIRTRSWHAAFKRAHVQDFHSGHFSSLNKVNVTWLFVF